MKQAKKMNKSETKLNTPPRIKISGLETNTFDLDMMAKSGLEYLIFQFH